MIIVLIEKILRTHEDKGKESILLPIAEKLLQELTSQQKNQKFHLDISNLHDLARQKRALYPDSATSIDRNFLTNIQEVGQSSGSSSKASAKNRRKKKNKNKVNNPASSISNAETKEAQPTEKAKTIIEHKEEVESLESPAITVTKVSKNRKRKNKKKSLATLPSKDSSNNEKSEKEKPSIRANSELAPATFSSSRDRKYRRNLTLNDFISTDVKERIFKTSSYKRRLRLLQTDRREGPSVSTERQSKLEPIANIKLPQVAYSIMQLIPNSYLVGNKVREEVSKTILGVNSNHFYENGQFELVSTQPLPLQKTLLIGGLLFIRNEQNPNLFVHDEIFKINLVFTDQSLLQHANSLDFSVNAFYANSDGDVFDPLNKAKQGLLDRKADLLNGLDCFTAQPCSILTYIRLLSLGYEEKYSPDTLKNYYSGLSALTSDKVNHELCQLFMNGFALRSFDVLERFELLDLFFPNIDDEGKKWLKEQLKNSDFLHAQQKLSKVFIFKLFISARLQSDIRNGNKESITLKDVKEIMREFNYPQSLQKKITRQLSVAITRMQKQEEQEVKDVNPEQSTSQPNPDRQVLPRAPIAIGRLFDRNPQDPTSKGHQPAFRP